MTRAARPASRAQEAVATAGAALAGRLLKSGAVKAGAARDVTIESEVTESSGTIDGVTAHTRTATVSVSNTVHSVALGVIAVVVAMFALRTAAAFFIPLLLSLFLNYALAPLVERMSRFGIPRALGAAIVVALVAALLGAAFYRVSNDLGVVLEQLPAGVERVRVAITETRREHGGALEHVERAATELAKLADAAAPLASPVNARATPVVPAAGFDLHSVLLVGTGSAVTALGQFMSALFLTYFLLAAGDLFRRKLLEATGRSSAAGKTAVRILDEIDRRNQRYFAVVLVVNIAVGALTGLGLYALGIEQPVVWGVAAAILHTIPYLGSALVAGCAALVAYGQFGTLQSALVGAGVPLAAAGLLGVGLQTWLMGRAARMNAPAVFVSLLFWGMLWGGWGLLLAVPVMVAIKTVCDHVARLKPIGSLLGP